MDYWVWSLNDSGRHVCYFIYSTLIWQASPLSQNLPAIRETWVGKIPWRRAWQPTPVFWPGESHGQRSLAGCSPWDHKQSDTTWLSLLLDLAVIELAHVIFSAVNFFENMWRKCCALKKNCITCYDLKKIYFQEFFKFLIH